jgi:hypothetical protein
VQNELTIMTNDHIDSEGFRANVGIILSNDEGKLLLAGRIGHKGWQFPLNEWLATISIAGKICAAR